MFKKLLKILNKILKHLIKEYRHVRVNLENKFRMSENFDINFIKFI